MYLLKPRHVCFSFSKRAIAVVRKTVFCKPLPESADLNKLLKIVFASEIQPVLVSQFHFTKRIRSGRRKCGQNFYKTDCLVNYLYLLCVCFFTRKFRLCASRIVTYKASFWTDNIYYMNWFYLKKFALSGLFFN